ncbi:HAD-like domain-containing protein [Tribonema minus]|uniref:HAD-like domain-containing protein n=1 Tax=Tribonema minus TaxID=303371 RepID=A0A835YU48_9STRA|nr:HAD-like domain-containing protein [Tribonema minus]
MRARTQAFGIDGVLARGKDEIIHASNTFCQWNNSFHTHARAQAFDIDGVLVRGKDEIPGAAETLRKLEQLRVPLIFLTNGGGCTEAQKAAELAKKFGIKVTRDMVLLSHTPMRDLAAAYARRRVLVLGSACTQIARKDLGLQNVTTVEEVAREWPTLYPFQGPKYYIPRNFSLPPGASAPKPGAPVEAVMVLHDPLDWALEAQVVTDVLRGGSPPGAGRADGGQTPWFISNPDFTFAAQYPHPRFAAGAFADVVKLLYKKRFGADAKVTETASAILMRGCRAARAPCTHALRCRLRFRRCLRSRCRRQYGKPTLATFRYAERMLDARAKAMGLAAGPHRIYMVGDNPAGDIRGANAAGERWVSNLVRTGLFTGAHNDPQDPADHVHDDARQCVDFVLQREGR